MQLKSLSLAVLASLIAATSAFAEEHTASPENISPGAHQTVLAGNIVLAASSDNSTGHASMKPHSYTVVDLVITNVRAGATPPKAPVAGGYMTIRNNGSEPDFLIGGQAGFSGDVQVHEMKMDGDVMKMRELADGLEIPAGGEVILKPGGYHVMFMKLSEPLAEGDKRKATLTFRSAGSVEVEFDVKSRAQMKSHGNSHSGGDHSQHGTSSQ